MRCSSAMVAGGDGVALLDAEGDGDDALLGVRDNLLESAGRGPAAWIETLGRCAFSDNNCRRTGEDAIPVAAVAVPRGSAIANANHLAGPPDSEALELLVGQTNRGLPAATVLGNITTSGISLNGSPLGAPWQNLNITT